MKLFLGLAEERNADGGGVKWACLGSLRYIGPPSQVIHQTSIAIQKQ
jgi:hypothetical protein